MKGRHGGVENKKVIELSKIKVQSLFIYYYSLKFRMLSRYRKLNGVMPLSATEIEDKCFAIED